MGLWEITNHKIQLIVLVIFTLFISGCKQPESTFKIVNSVSSVHQDGIVDWSRTILLNTTTGETWLLTRDQNAKTFVRWEPILTSNIK